MARRRREGAWTADEAGALLAEWRASGQRLGTFARDRGLFRQRLAWWRDRLGDGDGPTTPDCPPGMLAVRVRWPAAGEVVDVGGETLDHAPIVVRFDGWHVEVRNADVKTADWVAALARQVTGGGT